MSKVFILQKDIVSPTLIAKAGDRGKQNERDGLWWFDNFRYYFNTATVLGNPTWFQEEVKNEVASNDSFQWASDEDILEIIHRTFAPSDPNHEFTLNRLNEYKQSKLGKSHTPKPQAENKPDRDWEIVAYKNRHSGDIDNYGGHTWRRALIDHHPIHSVKRLSDGITFSVGDEVDFDLAGRYVHGHINHFTYSEGIIDIYLKEDLGTCYRLNKVNKFMSNGVGEKLRKLPSAPQPQKEEQEDKNDEIIGLLRDCVSSTWGNPSLDETQMLFDQFLHKRGLHTSKEYLNKFVSNKVNEILLNRKYTQQQVDELCEAAFNFSRDKLYNTDKSFRSWRFVNYQDYKQYVETSKTMYQKSKSQNQ